MELTLIENDQALMGAAIDEACRTASAVRAAVAFAKEGGLAAAPALLACSARGAPVQLLAGVDYQLTDLSALTRFERPPSEARIYLHPDSSARAVFHPKVYLAESSHSATAIIGSSNLTAGGLSANIEANILIRDAPDAPIIRAVRAFHSKLWNSGFAFRLTDRFRQHYERLQQRRLATEVSLRGEADFVRAQRDLRAAVVEAITSYRAPGDRRCWLLITSPANYIRNIEGRMWGDEVKRRIGQVRPGDLIYFYITRPLMQLGAMGMVTTAPYEDHTLHWQDGRVYPYRFGFTVLLRPPSPVPFRPLVRQLDLFGRADEPNWGQALQASMRPLTAHDCEVLRAALVAAEAGTAVA
jgi:HKD family nuclease